MKYAIFSDIHGNFSALRKALRLLSSDFNANRFLCLGDSLGRPPDPVPFADILFNKMKATSVKGNSDKKIIEKYTDVFPLNSLDDKALSAFNRLHETEISIGNNIAITHGSVFADNKYIRSVEDAKDEIRWMIGREVHFLFYGHTHVPGVIVFNPADKSIVLLNKGLYSQTYKLSGEKYYLINPGSVGNPKHNSRAGFVLFDDDELELKFIRL